MHEMTDEHVNIALLFLPSPLLSVGFAVLLLGHLGTTIGLAWLGLAWLGLAWLGLAWLGLAWLGLAWLGLAWLGLTHRFDYLRKMQELHAAMERINEACRPGCSGTVLQIATNSLHALTDTIDHVQHLEAVNMT